ncbi:MAG: hypothetical protein IT349_14615 [Candidatus Eisenbacteria bacterium]|nr:hypothetical protein [Candidatus Eisenbacteria bacterium]
MRASRWLPLVSLLVALFVLACGGSDGDPAGPGPADGPRFFRARIDGADWSVSSTNVAFAASHTSPGLYVLIGQVEGGHRIQIVLSSITGPGTYPLGVGAGPRGGNATLSLSPSTWLTPLSGAAGSITFTALSDTHMVGTFAFTAAAVGGTPASTKEVTEGEFDLAVTTIGTIGPVPDNAWSEVRTTIAGAAWNGATVSTLVNGPTLSIVAGTDTRTLTINIGEFTGPGTYEFSETSPPRSMTVIGDGIDPLVCCWRTAGATTGRIVVESLSSTRITGTFEAVAEASKFGTATGTVTLVGGTFSNGLLTPP